MTHPSLNNEDYTILMSEQFNNVKNKFNLISYKEL